MHASTCLQWLGLMHHLSLTVLSRPNHMLIDIDVRRVSGARWFTSTKTTDSRKSVLKPIVATAVMTSRYGPSQLLAHLTVLSTQVILLCESYCFCVCLQLRAISCTADCQAARVFGQEGAAHHAHRSRPRSASGIVSYTLHGRPAHRDTLHSPD